MSLPGGIPADWPLREASQSIACVPHRWHAQVLGAGETVLLLHGAGGATHSWRGLAPLLAADYRVVMLDLPGQGFSRPGRRDRFGLDAMAEDIAALCTQTGWHPAAVIGHSAGGAIALRLAEMMPLRAVIGINAALGRFDGLAGLLFPFLARALTVTPFVPALFARLTGTTDRVASLLASTGSDIGPEGVEMYRRLVARPDHVEGTLAMMAQWRLDELLERFVTIAVPTLLIAATGDRTVPPAVSSRAAGLLPAGEYCSLNGGHLLHEETPDAVAALILPFLARHCRVG
jgi:magnesium chelatase accessory protein